MLAWLHYQPDPLRTSIIAYCLICNSLLVSADEQVTQLYRHFQSKALPRLTLPPAAKLADVAKLSSKRKDWETAVAAAQDVAATDTQAAARLVNKIMGVMQMYGASISMAAAGMPVLHAAGQHDTVVQVILLAHLSCS